MSHNLIGITKQQYEQMCQESDAIKAENDQARSDLERDIMQEQVTNLEKQQFQLLTMIRDLTSISRPWHKVSDRTEREEERLGNKWVRFWRVTDNLGELRNEVRAFNSLPQ